MTTSLVFLSKESIPLTTTKIIADSLNYRANDVLKLCEKYLTDLQEFGHVPFKTVRNELKNNVVLDAKIAYLNEPQATLLICYMRNSEKVRKFKVALVKAFYEMRQALATQSCNYSAEEIARIKDKALRQGMAIAFSKMKTEAPKDGVAISGKSVETAYKMLKSHAENRREFCTVATKMNEMIKDIEYISRVLWYYSDFLAFSAPSALDELAGAVKAGQKKPA